MTDLVPSTVHTILEPSAGDGSLADALVETGFMPDCIELDPYFAKVLRDKGHTVVGSNFLTHAKDKVYDLAVMNPPYSKGQDTLHVARALEHAREVIALVRVNIFASKERYLKIWSHCNLIGFYPFATRPRFSESKGTLRHDVCVVHLQSTHHCEDVPLPVDFKVLGMAEWR